MSTFPIRKDEYSVEEISYEDMMTLLSQQELSQQSGRSREDRHNPEVNHPADSESDRKSVDNGGEPLQMPKNSPQTTTVSASHSSQDELSLRLSENANQSLPAWLLNH